MRLDITRIQIAVVTGLILVLGGCGGHSNSPDPDSDVQSDGALPDAGGPDAGGPDAGGPDAGGPDAGGPDAKQLRVAARADRVVVEKFLVGPGNLSNLRAAIDALQKRKKVIVLENDLAFDFTGGEAADCYRRLKEGGAVFIPDHSRLLEEVEKGLS